MKRLSVPLVTLRPKSLRRFRYYPGFPFPPFCSICFCFHDQKSGDRVGGEQNDRNFRYMYFGFWLAGFIQKFIARLQDMIGSAPSLVFPHYMYIRMHMWWHIWLVNRGFDSTYPEVPLLISSYCSIILNVLSKPENPGLDKLVLLYISCLQKALHATDMD